MSLFGKRKDYTKDPRYTEVKLRIVDSVDGIWIEKGYWNYDIPDGEWWYAWDKLDYYGRYSKEPCYYNSVETAKKRLKETNNFKDLVPTKYIEVEE